jgi:rhamnosyltransferase subunit B
MSKKNRIILSTFGSLGDLHPYMSLALELQARGHEPVIATMENYREKVANAGFSFAPVRPDFPHPKEQDPEMIEKILQPMTGAKFLVEEIIHAALRDSYFDLLNIVDGADLLVTHPAAPAGPLVGYKTGIRWISTVLAPLSFFSAYDPPAAPFWHWTNHLHVLGPRVMKFLLDTMKKPYKAKALASFREEIGVADYGNPIFDGQHSPHCVLALFSKVFAQPQPDWPKQTHVTGFCFYDGRHEQQMSSELTEFLAAGPPPIIFTLGSTAVWAAKDFFTESIEATKRLGRRALLLIGDDRNRPVKLPDTVIAVDYAPYQSLLPHASAVVHSGGAGTTSQALLAGVPTLILPFAFDQFDNAEHARRLRTSRTIYRKDYRAAKVAHELRRLLEDKTYSESAKRVSAKLKTENGPKTAADLIEQQLRSNEHHVEELAYASGD